MERFDDDYEEAQIIQEVIRTRRIAKAEPLKVNFFKRNEINLKKITLKGSVLDYCPYTNRYLIQESSPDRKMYFSRRLSLQFRDFETKGDIDKRRLKNMNTQKQAFLRVNLERMLLNEGLKLRPDLRQSSKIVNEIERLVDLPRLSRLMKRQFENDEVRRLAGHAEAVFASSMIKSIVMSEIEGENPRYVQYIKSFKVKRSMHMKTKYYAL